MNIEIKFSDVEIEVLRLIVEKYNIEIGNLQMQTLQEEKAYAALLKKLNLNG